MRRSLVVKVSRPRDAAASRPRRGLMSLLLSGLILAPAPAMTTEYRSFSTTTPLPSSTLSVPDHGSGCRECVQVACRLALERISTVLS